MDPGFGNNGAISAGKNYSLLANLGITGLISVGMEHRGGRGLSSELRRTWQEQSNFANARNHTCNCEVAANLPG